MTPYNRVHFNAWCIPLWVATAALASAGCALEVSGADVGKVFVCQLCAGAAVLLAAASTYRRVVHDLDSLTIRYGPLPLRAKSLPYELIESVELIAGRMAPPGTDGQEEAPPAGGKGRVRIRMKCRIRKWPPTLYAEEYVVPCREPGELAQFVFDRMADWPPLYDHNREFRIGCLLPTVLLAVASAVAAAVFGWGPVLGIWFLLGLGAMFYGLCLLWFLGGYRVTCFRDHVAIRDVPLDPVYIRYRDIESVDTSRPAWWRLPGPRTHWFGKGRPSLRIRLAETADVRIGLVRSRTLGLRLREPQQFVSVLMARNPEVRVTS